MKGILKIYHPDETLKYNIKSTYCKAVYSNKQHFLEVEVITDDDLDHVDDDSLQYHFPQVSLNVFDFLIPDGQLAGNTYSVTDSEDESFTEVNLFSDDDAGIYNNQLNFSEDADGHLELFWTGMIDDFYTGSDEPVPFKLKCHFKPEEIEVDED